MTTTVDKRNEWIDNLDLQGFGREMKELGEKLRKNQGAEDVQHLNKILTWNWLFSAIGIATMFLKPNIITITCLSVGLYSRWAMIGHHVCHGGYDNTEASKQGYSRWVFAVGSLIRRAIDWFDWMLPEAWNIEHGRLHHYSLNEADDPDLVQMNVRYLRNLNIPKVFKYAVVLFFALTWKWSYYSSNTYSQLLYSNKLRELNSLPEQMMELEKEKEKKKLQEEKASKRPIVTVFSILEGSTPSWWSTTSFLTEVVIPFVLYRFVLLPLPLLFFGTIYYQYAVVNLLLADLLTNLHAFLTIVPNHAGEDMYYFETHCGPLSDEFFLRQVIGSVDFSAGSDPVDFFHGFLNYQIEHHLWPDLSMLSYQRAHPIVKEICKKYNVPFVQHNVFYRLYKTVQIFVGDNSMILFPDDKLKKSPESTSNQEVLSN